MKRGGSVLSFLVICMSALAQLSTNSVIASLSSPEKLVIVKNSLAIPTWHEKNFWQVYEDYLKNINQHSSKSNQLLSSFAAGEFENADKSAYERGTVMLGSRFDVLTVRQRYYSSIGSSFNGIIALQFLQTEALFDMMEASSIYEHSRWKNFRFRPVGTNASKVRAAKHNMIKAALTIPKEQSVTFWRVYEQYEQECDALLGDNYNMISLYSSEPADFTPALAKRLGADFLNVMERELNLKQKYFEQMNQLVGPSLAAQFLAWEDYYSIVSKMYAWVEN